MAITSEFRPLTSGLMFEYRTDETKILKANGNASSEQPSKFFIYSGIDSNQYVVELNNLNNTLFPGDITEDYYFPGQLGYKHLTYKEVNANFKDPVLGKAVGFSKQVRLTPTSMKYKEEFKKVGTILKSYNYNKTIENAKLGNNSLTVEEAENGMRVSNFFHDTVRIYIANGYTFNSIAGLNIKVSVPIRNVVWFYDDEDKEGATVSKQYNSLNRVKRVNGKLYLLNWYVPKEMLWEKDTLGNSIVNWLPTPLYMNSRFYDRYIDIKVISPRSIYCILNENNELHQKDLMVNYIDKFGVDYVYSAERRSGKIDYYHGAPDINTLINVEVSTVNSDYLEFLDNESTNYYESTFNLDTPLDIVLTGNIASKLLNAQIYEDQKNGCIVYQPVWGDPSETNNLEPLNIPKMLQIESGTIPLIEYSDFDSLNDGIEDFIETYGTDVFKWVIINELSVSYYYRYIIEPDTVNQSIPPYTEYFTNTIDYTGKTDNHGEFWKSYFIPHIQPRANMDCDYIALKYTVHLYNRMNNKEIVKVSTAIIDNPMRYQSKTINTASIINYKIVNKIVKNDSGFNKGLVENNKTPEVIERNVRSYYSSDNIFVKQNGSELIETPGNIELKLYRKSHNYRFNIQVQQYDNTYIPFDLTGFDEYKLCFNTLSQNNSLNYVPLEIFPIKSSIDTNYAAGQLMFYITEEQVKRIMAVPTSERYFALTTHTQNGKDESTLAEGTVTYLTN